VLAVVLPQLDYDNTTLAGVPSIESRTMTARIREIESYYYLHTKKHYLEHWSRLPESTQSITLLIYNE